MKFTTRYAGAVAVGLVAAAALSACSGGSGSDSESKSLTIAGNSSERTGIEAVVADFKTANPGVTVDVTYAKDPATTLGTQLSAGTAADVLWVNGGSGGAASILDMAANGYVKDLSNEPYAAKQPKKSGNLYNDKVYSVALTTGGIGAVWNEDTLAAIGAKSPTTLPELLSVCDAAKAKGKVALAMGMQDSWVGQMVPYTLASTLVYSADPDFDKQQADKKVTFQDSNWTKVIDTSKELLDHGCYSKSPLGTSYDGAVQQVAKGTAAGMVMPVSVVPAILTSVPDAKLSYSAVPATDNAKDTWVPYSYGANFAINAKAKNATLAEKFIEFIVQPNETKLYAGKVGATPVLLDGSEPPVNPQVDDSSMFQYPKEDRISGIPNLAWPNAKVQGLFLSGLQNVFAGKLSTKDFLTQLQGAYDEGKS
ncbi:ABC transporter substrate-binding protein [Kribbella sp. CA-245084]|uniref:ABC transporter substrate-binding protein n=1 Tax=Kribbella sp. CA-245084 TaxID=3239940 RepID=UPI003D89FF2A